MLRDHRLNQIGEGANEVLLSFMALTGMRGPGMRLKEVADALQSPWNRLSTVGGFAKEWWSSRTRIPQVPVQAAVLKSPARRLGKQIRLFGQVVQRELVRHREEVLERQLVQQRLAWIAMELFAAACALSRWDHDLANAGKDDKVARLCVKAALHHAEEQLRAMWANDDTALREAAWQVFTDEAV